MAMPSTQEPGTAFRCRKPATGGIRPLRFVAHMLSRFKNAAGRDNARVRIIDMASNCGCTFFSPAAVERIAQENGLSLRDVAGIAAKAAKKERRGGNPATAHDLEKVSLYFRSMKKP